MKKSLSQIADIPWAANASVTKVCYRENSFEMVEYGRSDFMGNLITELAENV